MRRFRLEKANENNQRGLAEKFQQFLIRILGALFPLFVTLDIPRSECNNTLSWLHY